MWIRLYINYLQRVVTGDTVDRQAPMYIDDTTIFISQSDETGDTLNAHEYVMENDVFCVGITNTRGSTIAVLIRMIRNCRGKT